MITDQRPRGWTLPSRPPPPPPVERPWSDRRKLAVLAGAALFSLALTGLLVDGLWQILQVSLGGV